MDFNSMSPPLTLLMVLLMMSFCSCAPDFPIAKRGCQDHCGNVRIPYPFGVGNDCYLNDRFSIECRNSSIKAVDPPTLKPFLRNVFEITDISQEGQLRILQDIGYDCYKQNQRSRFKDPWISIGWPMTFNNTANKFTVIGCDSYAYAQGKSNNSREYTTGCMSICDYKEVVVDGPCSGIGCCQTSIPGGAYQINVTLKSYYNHSRVSSFNPCSYAFVVANDAFEFFADNFTNLADVVSLPVVVDWVVDYMTCAEARENSSTYACGGNSTCYVENKSLGYRCRCEKGYEGNPYLPNGCQDIDECSNQDLNNCSQHSTCQNKLGGHQCNCNKRYHDDGEGGCVADKNYWPIYAGVGVSTSTAILAACSFCLCFELTRRKDKRAREEFFRKNGGFILQQKLTGQGGGGSYTTRIFTIEELRKATNDFDERQIIGRGGSGTVFRGELTDKKTVAIKKSRGFDQNEVEQFINEVIVLSGINNRNVVKLIGCCLENEVPLLVYEFINNGALFEHLNNKIKISKLSWDIRLRIASEVAGVLSYLHSMASPPIIHRDIKSANILLDQNYTAKVSDFGISKLVQVDENQMSTVIQGTYGYLDPEYLQTSLLTEKSDVYSFGVVLLELLTGKKVLESDRPQAERCLTNHFLFSLKENQLTEVLDSSISSSENIEQMKEVAMIARRCISLKGENRPCMKDVERELAVLGRNASRQISVQVFEIDSSKSEALLGMQSSGYGRCEDSSSSYQYSASYATTQQPLLKIPDGR